MTRKQLKHFRSQLRENGLAVPPHCLDELEASAENLVRLYLDPSKPKRLRPSHVARELRAMAKGLGRASVAAERLGEQGMVHLLAASNSSGELDADHRPHIEYLARIARWALRAAVTAGDLSKSSLDNEGGRSTDQEMTSLIGQLAALYEQRLSVVPKHTTNPATGLGSSLFDYFAKDAIATFAPHGVSVEPAKVDEIVLQTVSDKRHLRYRKKARTAPPDV